MPAGPRAAESATVQVPSSSTRGGGWAPSDPASPRGNAEPPRAARRALRRRRGRARAQLEGACRRGQSPKRASMVKGRLTVPPCLRSSCAHSRSPTPVFACSCCAFCRSAGASVATAAAALTAAAASSETGRPEARALLAAWMKLSSWYLAVSSRSAASRCSVEPLIMMSRVRASGRMCLSCCTTTLAPPLSRCTSLMCPPSLPMSPEVRKRNSAPCWISRIELCSRKLEVTGRLRGNGWACRPSSWRLNSMPMGLVVVCSRGPSAGAASGMSGKSPVFSSNIGGGAGGRRKLGGGGEGSEVGRSPDAENGLNSDWPSSW